LGRLSLTDRSGRVVGRVLDQPKRLALLAYLAVRRDFVRRDELMPLFWPDADDTRGRAALRQAVAFLRAHLGPSSLSSRGREEIALTERAVEVDVWRFDERIRAGNLEEALELYRGHLLQGLHVGASNEFQDWLEKARESRRSHAVRAAWALALRHERSGSGEDAGFWAKRSLELSTYGEGDARRAMDLLDRVGDRLGALRVFRGLQTRLARDFGLEPSPETKAFVERLKARTEPHGPDSGAASGARGRRRTTGDRRAGDRRRHRGAWPSRIERRRSRDRRSRDEDRRNQPDRRDRPG
jgi:DNA-binding SARP family transcriptional activator